MAYKDPPSYTNPEFSESMFLDIKYFTWMINGIIEMNMFPGLTMERHNWPTYATYYILTDVEYTNDQNSNEGM